MTRDPDTEAYFREAEAWDTDRNERGRQLVRVAWRVAAAGWLCAVCCGVALAALMPLKRVEPFVVRVDRSTGVVDVVPVYAGGAPVDQVVTRYFLSHYVATCESFALATAESVYEECASFHDARRNQQWIAMWNANNPGSPLNRYRGSASVRVEVESISFFTRASGLTDLAQVRYEKAERAADGAAETITHWVGMLQYRYVAPSADPRLRRWNPLGFRVVEFTAEPEAESSGAERPGVGSTGAGR